MLGALPLTLIFKDSPNRLQLMVGVLILMIMTVLAGMSNVYLQLKSQSQTIFNLNPQHANNVPNKMD